LAKVLIDNPSMDLLASVTPNDFYDEVHQALFAAMSEQWAEERAINLSTLKSVLENIQNIAPDVTPIEYIRRLTTFGDSRNTADLAVTLRELANRRRLIAAAIDLQNTARSLTVKVSDAASMVVSALDEILSHSRAGRVTRATADEAFRQALDELTRDDSGDLIPTGLA